MKREGTGARALTLSLCRGEDIRAKKIKFRKSTAQNPYFYTRNKTFPWLSEDHSKNYAFSAEKSQINGKVQNS